ncbi:MAG: SRPBCC family protein, partial [Beijerinckiaceae bacterium]
MQYLLYAILVVFAIQAVILILAAMKPDRFRIERSISIDAPPQKVFPFINDLALWDRWSPWAEKDPNMKKTTGPATAGVGAFMEWDGDRNVGTGRMEIVESRPHDHIAYALTFTKPFTANNRADFTIEGQGPVTVRWAMTGPAPL